MRRGGSFLIIGASDGCDPSPRRDDLRVFTPRPPVATETPSYSWGSRRQQGVSVIGAGRDSTAVEQQAAGAAPQQAARLSPAALPRA